MIETYQRTIRDARTYAAIARARGQHGIADAFERVAATNVLLLERECRLEALRGPLWPARR